MKRIALAIMLLALVVSCGTRSRSAVQKKADEYALVKITAPDLSGITDNGKEVLNLYKFAADQADSIYWKQVFGDKLLMTGLADEDLKEFALINYGPWNRIDGKPFIEGYGERPLGANFYPADMTAEEFEYTIRNYAPGKAGSLYGHDTDWFKEITRTPISHKHSLAVAGGSEKFSHRTVLNVEKNQGLQKGNEASKYLFRTNVSQKLLEGWVDMDYNLSYTKRESNPANYGAFRQAFMHNPTEPVYDDTASAYGGYFTLFESDYSNPVAMLNERFEENETSFLAANVRATLNIIPVQGLKWDNFISYSDEKYFGSEYKTSFYPGSIGKKGVAYTSANSYNDFQWESTMQYSRVFSGHSIQSILGYTWEKKMNWSSNMENYGFDSDFYKTNNMGGGTGYVHEPLLEPLHSILRPCNLELQRKVSRILVPPPRRLHPLRKEP